MTQPCTYQLLTEQRIVRQLALEWIQSKLPGQQLTFVDCLQVLGRLQRATGDCYRTETIFDGLFEQAQRLDRSADWLADELAFETQAQGTGDRLALARQALRQSQPVDDLALDTYNDRLTRLASPTDL